MARGRSFDEYLAEELAGDPGLAAELEESVQDLRLGIELALRRESRRMTQQGLALASSIAQRMISGIETGDQQPAWPTLRRLIRALDATLTCEPQGNVTLGPARASYPTRSGSFR